MIAGALKRTQSCELVTYVCVRWHNVLTLAITVLFVSVCHLLNIRLNFNAKYGCTVL